MPEKEFRNIDESTLIKGFHIVHQNAIVLFRSAEQLSVTDYNAPATALLILSAEEAMKAIVLATKILHIDKNTEIEIHQFFQFHEPKLSLARCLQDLINSNTQNVIDFFISIYDKTCDERNKNGQTSNPFKKNLKEKIERIRNLNSKELAKWWDKANDLKLRSLYVSYTKKNWVSPSSIDKEMYLQTFDIISNILLLLEIIKTDKRLNLPKGRGNYSTV